VPAVREATAKSLTAAPRSESPTPCEEPAARGRAPGGGSYTTHLVVGFSAAERRARVATVGSRLPVGVNPDKPGKIAIDAIALLGQATDAPG